MGAVRATMVWRIVDVASGMASADELLTHVGLGREGDTALDRQPVISDDAFYELLEMAAAEADDELPLRYGTTVRPDHFGALGHALKTAPTLRDSLERLVRYVLVLTDTIDYEIREDADRTTFVLHGRALPRRGAQLANECALAAVVSTLRQVAVSPVGPTLVTFRHAAPASTRAHARYFGCPVRFGTADNAVRFDVRTLSARTRLADEGLSAYLLEHLDELRSTQGDRTVVQQVRTAVADTLCDGMPRKLQVARRLGMSERTLHRRLAEHGVTYQTVADDVRLEIAQSMLTDRDVPLGEVAFFTGFAEQSTFHRAFKRWTGQTPLEFREAAV